MGCGGGVEVCSGVWRWCSGVWRWWWGVEEPSSLHDLDGNYTLIAMKPRGFTLHWKQTMHKAGTSIPHTSPALRCAASR